MPASSNNIIKRQWVDSMSRCSTQLGRLCCADECCTRSARHFMHFMHDLSRLAQIPTLPVGMLRDIKRHIVTTKPLPDAAFVMPRS